VAQATTTRRRTRKPVVQEKPHWFEARSTGDLLILIIACTICFSVLAAGGALALLAFLQPERNLSVGFGAVADVINTLIGLLAGFLAGRTDAHMNMTRHADGSRTWEADRSANARTNGPAGL
jgi:hypothetical protein